MSKEKTPYNLTPGDYDENKLTDLHSPETGPSSYARNINKDARLVHTQKIVTIQVIDVDSTILKEYLHWQSILI